MEIEASNPLFVNAHIALRGSLKDAIPNSSFVVMRVELTQHFAVPRKLAPFPAVSDMGGA